MVVIQRAVVAIVVMLLRRGRAVMILATSVGRFGADGDPAVLGSEDVGIQPGQRANHHQPCQ